ncbi:NAD(P)/FAD-dependent oxidoreductase [Roseovarius aestuarii]|uniref:D-amino acid dehydrogenase small subunit n=1 Tax=Roseovarius aestuarii TaxID=475083 RepID=A0A1X7BNW5_9RHOB|nr:FAD-dependent oxidoreductase [Roseovarius aestuarii]SMC11210.1 D-amino acid dehydrogenase small subunit [Roseovarius aestuarii]
MPGTTVSEVVIVGGGIIGICSALSLLDNGVSVTLIERDDPGQGASFGNAGTISPWSIVPQAVPGLWKKLPRMVFGKYGAAGISIRHAPGYLPWFFRFLRLCNAKSAAHVSDAMYILCNESIELYQQHLSGTGHEDLIQDSMYVHAFRRLDEASINSFGNQLRLAKGAQVERIDGAELRRLEPALSPEFKAAILIHGQARALDPGRIGTVLSEKFQKAGGRIVRASARKLERQADGAWTIRTDQDTYSAPKVVISAGAWSAELLRPLGFRVPLAAERGYHLSYASTGVHLNNSIMDAENHVVANGMTPGLRIAGIADFAKPDSPPNPRHFSTLRHCARSMIPDLGSSDASEWMGVRPSFPDSLPVIEEVPGQRGLFAAFGHSHYGLMMAPKTGQIVASLVTGPPLNQDISVFGSQRF